MYRIDRTANVVVPLDSPSFGDLAFRERAHLQEWIAARPEILGEELLIIQKEFAGFSDTRERLDLLALDKQGSLVVIENKLDDTGRDVTWQALKYASYCASLTRDDIREIYQAHLTRTEPGASAQQKLLEFLRLEDPEEFALNRGVTQRIILVAASFRKEVTSTVLWLLNYKVRIQCFRATPYSSGDDLFLSVDQIIPLPDSEELTIRLASKAQEELAIAETQTIRQEGRMRFWAELLSSMNNRSELFRGVSGLAQGWISTGSGVRGAPLTFVAVRSHARVELYIDRGDKAENEMIFDGLIAHRAQIEASFGESLKWERLDTKRACRIKAERDGNVFDQSRWPEMIDFMVDAMVRFEAALRAPLTEMKAILSRGGIIEK